MRWSSVHIRGVGAALGELIPVAPGHPTEQQSISIVRQSTGMDLAVTSAYAALAVLAQITKGPLPIPRLHLHSANIPARLGLPPGPGITAELNAMSNSLVGGTDLASRILSGSTDLDQILLTGGEVFGPPAFEHLGADHEIAYGDSGSAIVLGRFPGFARVLAPASYTDPTLEQLDRGHHRVPPAGATEHAPERVRERKLDYLADVGASSVNARNAHGIRQAFDHALAEAAVIADQLARVLLPYYGKNLLEAHCLRPLGIAAERTLIDAGRRWGHIGPNDQIIGLPRLLARADVQIGDHVALVGIGVGTTWTVAVLRIEQVPSSPSSQVPLIRNSRRAEP
jgi:3-oxoacyl-[acyl-carrier-protein] synthase-3